MTELELEFKSKMVQMKKVDRNDQSSLRIADSGLVTEPINNRSNGFTERDVEAITDELFNTQEQLLKTEEQLLRSQALVQDLERNIQSMGKDAAAGLSGDENDLLKELDRIRKDIGVSKSQETQKGPIDVEYESQLRSSRLENMRLTEEIACLRNIIFEKDDLKLGAEGQEFKGFEQQQNEIESLRKKIEETVTENMALQETVQKLEMVGASPGSGEGLARKLKETEEKLKKSQEECSDMRSEILSLSESLYRAKKKSKSIDVDEVKKQKDELVSARNELVDRDTEIRTLRAELTSSEEKVRELTEEISNVTAAMQRLQSAVDKDSELRELRSEYKTLTERSESLLQQLEEVTTDVVAVRGKHDEANEYSKERLTLTKDLKDVVIHAVGETRQRNSEVEELALMMEKRMGSAELSIEALDSEIALAMKKLHGDKLALSGKKVDPLEIVIDDDSDLDSSVDEEKEKEEADAESIQTEENPAQEDTFKMEEKEEPVGFNSIESVLERTRRVLEVSETVDRLALVSKKSNDTDQASVSTVSLSSRKAHTMKYEDIMKKLANYEAMYSNENRELEAHADKGVEVRE